VQPTFEALRETLRDVDIAAIHLRLEPCEDAVGAAELLHDFIAGSGLAPERANAAFGLDPLAVVIARGGTPDAKRFVGAFLALRDAGFKGPLAVAEGRHFHEAGATEAQELAAILATAVWWLRRLEAASVSPEAALPCLGASIGIGCDIILSLAKVRALRLLWARLQEVCEAPKSGLNIHAETSRRMLSRTDVLDNLLRNTLAAFAAGVGGADSVSVIPHTAALGITDRNARALARNIQHLLMLEADLHRVADPAAGSGAVEALTEAIAARAWEEFQTIEREGDIAESLLRADGLHARIAAASTPISEATT
jgi:methylmalonyl-CoA mutase